MGDKLGLTGQKWRMVKARPLPVIGITGAATMTPRILKNCGTRGVAKRIETCKASSSKD